MIIGDFNTLFSTLDIRTKKETDKEIEDLNNTIYLVPSALDKAQ